jgi:hypothetical protein
VLGYNGGLAVLGESADEKLAINGISGSQIDVHVVKADVGHVLTPLVITMARAKTDFSLANRLVTISDAEFKATDTGRTYTQPNATTNRNIEDCSNNSIVVRSSNYANFNAIPVPKGKGTITGIYTVYQTASYTTPQLIIRDTSDVKFYGDRCGGGGTGGKVILDDPFTDLNNWTAVSVTGAQQWAIATYGNPKPCASISGFSGGNNANEDWLISKSLDLNGVNTITFTFENASKYTGNQLQCYISTNYPGSGDPNTATWTLLPAVYDQSNAFTFTNSGAIDLSAYKNKQVRIAFKYTSTTSAAATWEVDNVKVTGN